MQYAIIVKQCGSEGSDDTEPAVRRAADGVHPLESGREENVIPKIIHYCWFGRGEKSEKMRRCMASWQKYCPDYRIVEWNEDNFDVEQNGYTRMCLREKKYAFLSDYVRLAVVAEHGGIYLDTDVELLRAPDLLLAEKAFWGFETLDAVNSGLGFGSEAHGQAVEAMLREYDPLLDGKHGTIGCPRLNTSALVKLGLRPDGTMQHVAEALICPGDWFNPYDSATGRLNITKNTISIHWYSASWMSRGQRLRCAIGRPLHRLFGVDFFRRVQTWGRKSES